MFLRKNTFNFQPFGGQKPACREQHGALIYTISQPLPVFFSLIAIAPPDIVSSSCTNIPGPFFPLTGMAQTVGNSMQQFVYKGFAQRFFISNLHSKKRREKNTGTQDKQQNEYYKISQNINYLNILCIFAV